MGIKFLGIDPGYARLGWGLIEVTGNRAAFVDAGVFETSSKEAEGQRLLKLQTFLQKLFASHTIAHAALEPMNCVVKLTRESCEVWNGEQFQTGDQFAIVRASSLYYSLPPEDDGQPRRVYSREVDSRIDGERGMLWHHGPNEFTFSGNVEVYGYEVLVIGQVTVTKAGDPSSVLVTYSDMEVRPGDLIVAVDDTPIASPEDLSKAIQVAPNFAGARRMLAQAQQDMVALGREVRPDLPPRQ